MLVPYAQDGKGPYVGSLEWSRLPLLSWGPHMTTALVSIETDLFPRQGSWEDWSQDPFPIGSLFQEGRGKHFFWFPGKEGAESACRILRCPGFSYSCHGVQGCLPILCSLTWSSTCPLSSSPGVYLLAVQTEDSPSSGVL